MPALGVAPLFVPGTRPDRVRKASERGARTIVVDLEDAVLPEQRPEARSRTVEALSDRDPDRGYLVRVNPVTTPDVLRADLDALAGVLEQLQGVVLPKVEDADAVRTVLALLPPGLPVVPTIESARGVRSAWDIADAAPEVLTLLFGTVDLSAQLGVTGTPERTELATAAGLVVLACAAAGRARPIDGPHLGITDVDGLRIAGRTARRLGFGGKVVIHPEQLSTVTESFAPSPEEVTWAHEVLEADDNARRRGDGAARTSAGTFVDVPVVTQARTILALADGGPS